VEAEEEFLSPNLSYKPVDIKKEEEKLKHSDPKKAAQLERLGMGLGTRTVPNSQASGRSHSASASMATVEQVGPERDSRRSSKDKYGNMTSQTGFFDRLVNSFHNQKK